MQKLTTYCDKIISWSFYTLFFFVPLFFTNNTSELFELNKMWLTWGLTVLIIGSWLIKMTLERRFFVRRTPLDIPIILFLLSQLIATIFSLDSRVSFWGYYSRFNGGFLSILTYTLLYFAFVSNTSLQQAKRYLYTTLFSAVIVALWGLPSHFGSDPTCLLFRGTLDTSCWTESFKPTIRIFSTLGQPAWMAAYLAVLLPITFSLLVWQKEKARLTDLVGLIKNPKIVGLFVLSIIFYLDLLFTDTRAGFIAFWAAFVVFWGTIYLQKLLPLKKLLQYISVFTVLFLACNFFVGTPIPQLDKVSLRTLTAHTAAPTTTQPDTAAPAPAEGLIESGITDSGSIRLLVWKGAVDAWKAHPLFGTGVETYAFAYYLFRPAAHNMTSEWDYLYNKAHNEYLNYLATTGAFGLGTHVLLLGGFLLFAGHKIIKNRAVKKDSPDYQLWLYAAALPAAFVSIILSNFFGFSVVMINIFLYILPAWFFFFTNTISDDKAYTYSFAAKGKQQQQTISGLQWTALLGISAVSLIFLFQLIVFWRADTQYALGSNLNHAGDYQAAYTNLSNAVQARPAEPVFKDEFAINLATIATALTQNNDATNGSQLAQQAINLSDDIVSTHPNNVVFWKSRVRVFYLLAQTNPQYYKAALDAILKAKQLAPTDAKVSYNVGVLYGQNGKFTEGIKEFSNTIKLKPNYRDAHYARAIFYHQLADNAQGTEKQTLTNQAIADLRFIIDRIDPNDSETSKLLTSWGAPLK